MENEARFSIIQITDTHILLCDLDTGISVTNDASNVVEALDHMVDGIGHRHIYYRDTTGLFDELCHHNGRFTGFAPCSNDQQSFLGSITQSRP